MHVRHLLLALITLCLPTTQLPKRVGAALSNNNTKTTHQPAAGWKANAIRCLKTPPLPTCYQFITALAVAAVGVAYLFRRELLRASAGRGYLLPVKLLITCGVDVNSYFRKSGGSDLFWAAAQGHTTVVAYLLTIEGIEKNGVEDKDNNLIHHVPLVAACAHKHPAVVALFLKDQTVDKNPLCQVGEKYITPLMAYCLYANKDETGNQCLSETTCKALALLFIQHMTEEEINCLDLQETKTALDYAIENGDQELQNALKGKNGTTYEDLSQGMVPTRDDEGKIVKSPALFEKVPL